jgi:hypothetical protein
MRQAQIGRPVRLMFQDEARFGCISDPRRCWAPPGVRPVVGAHVVRQYTYAFAAVSPHDGILDSLILPVVNAQTMSLFLEEVAARHAEEFVLMILDGAGWHQATALKVPENMRLVSLPPYSPELNPAEHLWEDVREKGFPNLVFRALVGVEDILENSLCTLENDPKRVASLTGFDWIISIPLIAP